MKRSFSTLFLITFLTLGFLGIFGVYLPNKVASFEIDQVIAAPVSLSSFSDIAPSDWELQAPADSEEARALEVIPSDEPLPQFSGPPVILNAAEEFEKYPLKEFSPLPLSNVHRYSARFQPSPNLMGSVEFWRNLFARYGQHHSVVHDTKHLNIIYGVLDFSNLYGNPGVETGEIYRVRRAIEEMHKAKIKEMLLRFASGGIPLTPWEDRIYKIFQKNLDSYSFRKGAENLRAQWGQNDRFQAGLIRFARYQPLLEQSFIQEGVPPEITRLTFVESMFTNNAVSKVGAAGPWQFMLSTGKSFLQINKYLDQRYDPLLAGSAAAKLLKKNYDLLKSWPLAINAYNTGALRLLKAIRKFQTDDIGTIVLNFDDPGYQFASRNFYPEFLAALEVSNNYKEYFGHLKLEKPIAFEELVLPYHTSMNQVAITLATDVAILKDLNPAYFDEYFSENTFIPQGYSIRVPRGEKSLYLAAMDQIHNEEKDFHWHVVAKRDTLPKIASRYKVTTSQLMQANRLLDSKVQEGQILKIPGAGETLVLETR